MALTAEVKKTRSPVGQWMREQFPDTQFFTREVKSALSGRAAQCALPPETPSWVHAWAGTAFDYRLRMALAPMSINATVAGRMMRPEYQKPGSHVLKDEMAVPQFEPYPPRSTREETTGVSLWDWHQAWVDEQTLGA